MVIYCHKYWLAVAVNLQLGRKNYRFYGFYSFFTQNCKTQATSNLCSYANPVKLFTVYANFSVNYDSKVFTELGKVQSVMGNMARGFLIKINEILGNDVEQNSEDLQKGAYI